MNNNIHFCSKQIHKFPIYSPENGRWFLQETSTSSIKSSSDQGASPCSWPSWGGARGASARCRVVTASACDPFAWERAGRETAYQEKPTTISQEGPKFQKRRVWGLLGRKLAQWTQTFADISNSAQISNNNATFPTFPNCRVVSTFFC